MFFGFNQYSSLLLIGFLQGIVYALLLYRRGRREDRLSDHLLAILLLLCCAYIAQWMLGFGHWYDSHDWRSTFMFYFPFHTLIFIGPVIYFYFRSLTNRQFRFRRKDGWHLIPGFVILAIYLATFVADVVVAHWIGGEVFPEHFGTQGRWSSLRQEYVPSVTIGLISTIIYTVFTIRVYRGYRKYLNQHFSETENLRFGWLRVLLYAIVIGLAVNWGVQIVTGFMELSYAQYWTSHFALSLMVYFLAIQGYSVTTAPADELRFEPQEAAAPKKAEADQAELDHWKPKLIEYMENEKPYLEPQLTLNELATQLGASPAVLSRIINSGFDQNFNDFINQYRVQAVQQKLKSGENNHLSLLGIALECGFNSKATFNRTFKKLTGKTPSQFVT